MAKRPLVFGVLNVTPDSFSDGGAWTDPERAVEHAHEMIEAGADVIDVGGESTRPGAARIDAAEERRRVEPVINALIKAGIPVSLDTTRSETARLGLDLGVGYINDVSGGLADPAMMPALVGSSATYIAMHWRGDSEVMDDLATYSDVTAEVVAELSRRVEVALDAGIDPDRLWIDPGLGFAKNVDHNWQILRDIDRVIALGYPVLLGASRKRFLAPFGETPEERDDATAVISVLAADVGVSAVRVHNVETTVSALTIWETWKNAGS